MRSDRSHRNRVRAVGAAFGVLALTAGECPVDEAGAQRAALALHHAPVIYQDTSAADPEADFLTRFDYDNNNYADDNWDVFDEYRGGLAAFVYYSVVATQDHWYIVYAFFHPRDWTSGSDGQHENDLEGALAVVRRDGSEFGVLEALITVFHLDFYTFTPDGPTEGPVPDGIEDVDGPLSFQLVDGVQHPVVVIEAEGHGVQALPFAGAFSGRKPGNPLLDGDREDGIVYRPARSATIDESVPSTGNDRDVRYTLLDLVPSLWSLQMAQVRMSRDDAPTFASFGTLKGDVSATCPVFSCGFDKAHAPWGWDDEDDGSVYAGELALDPAHVAIRYLPDFPLEDVYEWNPYLTDLAAEFPDADDEPAGWPDDLVLAEVLAKAPTATPSPT